MSSNVPSRANRANQNQMVQDFKSLPPEITGFILGDEIGELTDEELSRKLDHSIVQNSTMEKRCVANVAMTLYAIRTVGTYKVGRFKSWEDYVKAMAIRHQAFSTTRQASRYLAAVETFVIKYGYQPSIMQKFHPNLLGMIAESGVVRNEEDAKAWLRLAEYRSQSDINDAIRTSKAQIEAPEVKERKIETFDPNKEEPIAAEETDADEGAADDGISDAIPVEQAAPAAQPAQPAYDPSIPPFLQPQAAPAQPVQPQEPIQPALDDDRYRFECVRSSGEGPATWTIFVKRGGIIMERYVTRVKPQWVEMTEDEASELNREKRNIRVEEKLRDALGG